MLLELWSSFRDNFRQKSRNPFFGTLIIVWIVKNWKLVYALFYFDDTYTLTKRIEYIELYYKNINFFWNLMYCLWLTVLSLIGSYLLLNLSRLIINLYEKKLTPWIYRITDKNSIVLKTDLEKAQQEVDRLTKKYEDEKKRRIELATEIEELEKKLIKSQEIVNTPDEEHTTIPLEEKICTQLIELNYTENFSELLSQIGLNGYFPIKYQRDTKNDEFIQFINKFGLLKKVGSNSVSVNYNLTELGEKVKIKFLELT